MSKCPLCDSQATFDGKPPLDMSWDVDCPLCGRYILAATGNIQHILTHDGDRRHLVRGYLQEMRLRPDAKLVTLTEESALAIADAAPGDVPNKLDRLC